MTEDLKGRVFNERYTLLEKIGAGGMATVYRAKDENSSRPVAIKILSRDFLTRSPKEAERNLRRFKREAEILKLLSGSPHVVAFVEHACSESGDWYIAMELLEGEQLRYYIGRGRSVMGVSTFVHFANHLLEGLKEIHSRNILHRDLAPDNVIVVKDESGLLIPKFLDFGIGKSTGNELEQVTQILTIMGKPQYFSPEQARGLELTPASDLYSMGVMLYEMVTGYVPLDIHGIPDFRKIQKDPPAPITNYREGQRIPAELQDVIMRCLEKSPEKRPLLDEILEVARAVRTRVNAGEIFDTSTVTGPTADHTTPLRLSEVEFSPGDKINRYEIKSLLGKGGMGAVYLAWDPVLHREVAIKVATRIEEERAKKALLREARASSALRSENVVTIFDAGTEGGTPYIAMEYVNGATLAEIIERDGPITGERFWELANGILNGLRYAHERDNPVVHRDLKPANMLVDRRGIKITDFGIARVSTGRGGGGGPATVAGAGGETMGHGGHGEGTVATMSPEQANGKAADIRSDIYSLGCVFYMMVTGRAPFQGNPIAILYQHCTTPPDPPSKHAPGLEPKGLDAVILKCLEKEPETRYQTVGEIQADLRSLFVGAVTREKPLFKTKAGLAVIAAAVVALLVIAWALFFRNGGGGAVVPVRFELRSLDDEAFVGGRTEPLLTSKSTLRIDARAKPLTDVVVTLTPQDGAGATRSEERITADDSGVANRRIRLPIPPETTSARFEVTVAPSDEGTPETFGLVYDGGEPELFYKPFEVAGDWLPASGGNRLAILREESVVFLAKDSASGLRDPGGAVVPELKVRPGSGGSDTIRLEWKPGDRLDVVITDVAGNTLRRTFDVERVRPLARFQRQDKPVGAGPLAVDLALGAEGIDLAKCPPELAPKVQLAEAGAMPVTLAFDAESARWTGSLPLPEVPNGEIRSLRVLATVAGIECGTLDLRCDREAPVLTLSFDPDRSGTPKDRWTSGNAPATLGPLQVLGGNLSKVLAISVSDGAGALAENPEIEVKVGGGEVVKLPCVPGEALSSWPPFPSTPGPIPVEVRATDAAGNTATLRFSVEMIGAAVTSLLAAGRAPTDDVLYVRDATALEVRAEVAGLTPDARLFLEVVGADGESLGGGKRLAMVKKDGAWIGVGVDLRHQGRPFHACRLRLGTRETPAEGEIFLKEIALVLDALPPQLSITAEGYPESVPANLVAGSFPTLRVTASDRSALAAANLEIEVSSAPANLPKPLVRREARKTDAECVVDARIESPAEGVQAGRYTIKVTARDPAGNTASTTTVLEVKPADLGIVRINGLEMKRRAQFQTDPIPLPRPELAIVLRNATGAGRYRVKAIIVPDRGAEVEKSLPSDLVGSEPMPWVIDGLPGDSGTILVVAQEVVGATTGPGDTLETIKYAVDTKEPEWEVLVNGVPTTLDRAALLETGIKVASLDALSIRVFDSGGFPETLPPTTDFEREIRNNEIVFRPKRKGEVWTREDLRFTVPDRAGNSATIRIIVVRLREAPSLTSLAPAEGSSVELGSGLAGTTSTRFAADFANENPNVLAVEASVVDARGQTVGAKKLDADAGRKRFTGSIEVPGDGIFDLVFRATTASAGTEEPFHTWRVRVDRQPPTLDARGAAGATAPLSVERLEELVFSANDESGVRGVDWAVGPVGSATTFIAADAAGPSEWRVQPGRTPGPGEYELALRATDRLGNTGTRTLRVGVRAPVVVTPPNPNPNPNPNPPPPPPPPKRASRAELEARTGMSLVEVVAGGRPVFYMSKTEVTVGQFRVFADEFLRDPMAFKQRVREGRPIGLFAADSEFSTSAKNSLAADVQWAREHTSTERQDLPMFFVTGKTAAAYALWAGGRLPTVKEWNGAAGQYVRADAQWPVFTGDGGTDSSESRLEREVRWANFKRGGRGKAMPVSSLEGSSPFGLVGMAGNVQEWVTAGSSIVGTCGGSWKYERNDANYGARLTETRSVPRGVAEDMADVGIRVVWDP